MQLNTRAERKDLSSQTSAPFFVAGGTLSRDAACYVTRKADEDLLKGLRQGQFCYVLTSRQMGKSSLMVRAATQLRQEGVAVAVLDLTAIGQNLTPEQWYDGLLNRVGRQLNLEDELDDFWEDNAQVGPFQRFMRALFEVVLQKAPGRIVIFIDEIDAVRSLPFSTDEFFAGIRECYNSRVEEPDLRRLTFALFGVASPSDLIRDTHTTPFNIGQRIELRDFTPEEAAPLAMGLAAAKDEGGRMKDKANPDSSFIPHPSSFASILNRVLYWTNGHPYLTQRLCQALVEQATSTHRPLTVRDVDALCEELYLSPRARERDDNLLFVREWLLRSEVDTAGLLDLYANIRNGKRIVDEETNRFVDVLRLSGVARSERGALLVRNRIYAHVFDRAWVLANMPDAELQRQRAAYRKGLIRALALSSVVLLVMGILTAYAFKREREAKKAEAYAFKREREAKKAESNERAARKEENGAKVKAQVAELNERSAKNKAEDARKQAQKAAEQERREALEAERQKKNAIDFAMKATDEKQKAQRNEQRATRSEHLEREQKERVERLSYPDSISHALKALNQPNIIEAQNFLDRYAHPPDTEHDLRGFEWRYLKHLSSGNSQRTFQGHAASVHNLSISPDGTLLASAGKDFIVQMRDLQTGQMLPMPAAVKLSVPQVAFSPDKRTLAIATHDGILLWDVPTARLRATLPSLTPQGKPVPMSALAYSPDGKMLAMGSYSGSIDLWDTATNRPLRHLLHHPNGDYERNNYQIDSVAFSPDGKCLASCLWDHNGVANSTKLWDTATGRELSTLDASSMEHQGKNRVYSLAFSSNGNFLATGGQDHVARVWNARDASHPTLMQKLATHANEVTSVAFSANGKWLATGSSDGGIKLWDANRLAGDGTQREATTLRGHTKGVTSVAFTPDSRTLVSGSQDKTLKVWDIASALPVVFPAHPQGQVYTLAYSRDGKLLATANVYGDKTVCIWDSKTLTRVAVTKPHPNGDGVCAAFAPDGKTIAVAGADNTLTLCDTATGQEVAHFKGLPENFDPRHFSPDGLEKYNTVAFSPDGKYIATGGQAYTHVVLKGFHPWNGYHPRLWDVATHKEIPEFARHQGHYGWVLSVAFSPDSKTLVSGGGEGELRWWDIAARKEIGDPPRQSNGTTITADFAHQNNLFALAFSPDGKWLVTGSEDNTARLWDARTRKPVATLLGHPNIVYAAAFSSDNNTLATGSRDGLIKLWSLANLRDKQQVLETIDITSYEGVRSLDFSPDGNTLAVGLMNGSVRLWQAEPLSPAKLPTAKRGRGVPGKRGGEARP